MIHLGKHIDKLDCLEFVAPVNEDAKVTGECRRLAGFVDNVVRYGLDTDTEHPSGDVGSRLVDRGGIDLLLSLRQEFVNLVFFGLDVV